MTERTYSTTPQNATPTQSAFNAVANNPAKDALPHSESVDDEPYTIKCICDYTDDDGNTIYCERCDTWQHIECFYPGHAEEASRDDFSHFCADCSPRPLLERRKATERQRQQRQDRPLQDSADKKAKRLPSKSHKKKPRPHDVQTNGQNHDQDVGHTIKVGSPLEQHSTHPKKSKGHRSHASINSQAPKRSPSHTSKIQTNGHPHPLSPATTPPDLPDDFRIHSYSEQLRDLYENDPGHQKLQVNTFAGLTVGNTISQWLRDPEKLRTDTGVSDIRDVFNIVKPEFGLDAQPRPELQVIDEPVENDPTLHLRSLIVVEPVRSKDHLIGELNGMVGFQSQYVGEEPDRYSKLCHPAPFVFFHPRLPLYIDTRREGSQCRYIRRSCRANTTLDTYITNQTEYHFCVLNDRPLAAREKITLAWDFRFPPPHKARYLYLLGLSDEDSTGEPHISEVEYAELTELIHNVLSDYGGCACGLGADCAFARFHRNYLGKSQAQINGTKSKKSRKSKAHISPTSTGHATNSRDVSEGRQETYDGEDDSRSTSGSTRSKPQSRDMTPVANGISEAATEMITEREKRKLANYEKTFEKMDQEQPPRKKKRTSDSHTHTNGTAPTKMKQKSVSSSVSNSITQLNGSSSRPYVDAGTSRQHSASPTSAQSPPSATPSQSRNPSRQGSVALRSRQTSLAPRSNYSNACVQTDDVDDSWFSTPSPPKSKKRILSLGKRLLQSQHKSRSERELRRVDHIYMMDGIETQSASHASSPEMHEAHLRPNGLRSHSMQDGIERPRSGHSSAASVDGMSASNDVIMTDISPSSATGKPPPPSWSSVFVPSKSPTENRSTDLRVQMPPIPSFPNNNHSNTYNASGTITPSSATGSLVQSPFGQGFNPPSFSPSVLNSVGQHPSPVKKKLSLKDYRAIRASASSKSSTDGQSGLPTLNPSTSLVEESKVAGVLEGSAVMDSPVAERVADPIAASGEELQDTSPAQSAM
jgi:hypothetical protein